MVRVDPAAIDAATVDSRVRRHATRRGVIVMIVVVAGLFVLATAVVPHPVGPARTYDKYRGKAVTTAESALSDGADRASHGRQRGTRERVLSLCRAARRRRGGEPRRLWPRRSTRSSRRTHADALQSELDELLRRGRDAYRHGAGDVALRDENPTAEDLDAWPPMRSSCSVRGAQQLKKLLSVTLGILTAIGGFVDIGDLVANAEAGARFGLGLAWVVVVGVVGIIVYAEMCGRVAAVSGRPVFSLVRERLGPGFGLANLVASFFINFLTLTAEIAGVAIAVLARRQRPLPPARPVRRRCWCGS